VILESITDTAVCILMKQVGDKDTFSIAQESFQAQSRAESMVDSIIDGTYIIAEVSQSQVRAADSLLSITHSIKLLLLLSDEAQIASRRDAELKVVTQEKNGAKERATHLSDELLESSFTRRRKPEQYTLILMYCLFLML
jgi:mediator of RNA polymerase II transcription subunit 22